MKKNGGRFYRTQKTKAYEGDADNEVCLWFTVNREGACELRQYAGESAVAQTCLSLWGPQIETHVKAFERRAKKILSRTPLPKDLSPGAGLLVINSLPQGMTTSFSKAHGPDERRLQAYLHAPLLRLARQTDESREAFPWVQALMRHFPVYFLALWARGTM